MRRITPTLVTLDHEATQPQQTAELFSEVSSVLESSDSSRGSESPSFLSPHDNRIAKLEKKMRKGKKNEPKKIPLSSFLSEKQESRLGLNKSKFSNLSPNLERKFEKRLHLSPVTSDFVMEKFSENDEIKKHHDFESPVRNSLPVEVKGKQICKISLEDVKEKAKIDILVELYHCILSGKKFLKKLFVT